MQITRIKPGGWLLLLLALAGIIYGFRSCAHLFARPQGNATATGGDFGGGTGGAASTVNPTTPPASGSDILVSTTGTKQKWMQAEIDKFNAQAQGGHARLNLTESRESMQGILNGKLKPTVWSPSSPVWTDRLADLWPKTHGGAAIADVNSSDTYRVLFKSPLVFLTTKEKAGFLRPVLSGTNPWEAVRQFGLGSRRCPWGPLRFSYADPLNASSGMLTMSLILTEYGRTHGAGDLTQAAGSPQFSAYLGQIDRSYVRDAAVSGSSKLEQAFSAGTGGRDFITAYENAALGAAADHPDLVLIYPTPTADAEQGAALLSAPWVSSDQKATAKAFLDFLGQPQALSDGIGYDFRPSRNGGQALADHLPPAVRTQFQQSYTSVDLPPYDALNEAAAQWRAQAR